MTAPEARPAATLRQAAEKLRQHTDGWPTAVALAVLGITDQPDARVLAWLDNPDGGGRFTNQRDAIRSHDQTCPGLARAWLPRRGGVSCPTDFMSCDVCDIEFFWDGLIQAFDDCPESNHWYCACCLAKTTTCGCTPGATR